jgi:hypothetical protein
MESELGPRGVGQPLPCEQAAQDFLVLAGPDEQCFRHRSRQLHEARIEIGHPCFQSMRHAERVHLVEDLVREPCRQSVAKQP